jgi:hypothetical protein
MLALLAWCAPALAAAGPATRPFPSKPAELFRDSAIWNIHLKFTAEQWQAMEPRNNGGAQPPRAQPAHKVFLQQADQDHDGKLSREEFTALGEKWFTRWDKPRAGKLNINQLRSELTSVMIAAGAQPQRLSGANMQAADGRRNGLAAFMGIDFNYVHADVEFENKLFKNVAVRFKGNGTFVEARNEKRPFKIDLNEFVKGQKLCGITKLNLQNNITDAGWMNEVLAYRLFRDAGVPAPRTAYARVYVTIAGQQEKMYLGLYSLSENVDRNFAEEILGTSKGAIFKPVTPALFSDLGDDWKRYAQTYDPKANPSVDERKRLLALCQLVTHADDDQFAAKLGEFIDLDQFARFLAVNVFLSDLDGIFGPGQNFYLHLHPKTHKFTFIAWDQDRSFGCFRGTQEQRDDLSIHRPWFEENPFMERVFKVAVFKKLYLAKLEEFSKSIFKPERFVKQVDELAPILRPTIEQESPERLARFDLAAAGQQAFNPSGHSSKPIKAFVADRTQSITSQLAGRSRGETLAVPVGMVTRDPTVQALTQSFMTALDADSDGQITRDEFTRGFAKWFDAWNTDKSGSLTEAQLRIGIQRLLVFSPGRPRIE